LERPDAGWTYVEVGADAGAATHTWTTTEVTRIGPYTAVSLQGDDALPTVRLFIGPKGLSAAICPGGLEELTTAAVIGKYWTSPEAGLYLPSKLAPGVKASFSFADLQQGGTLRGTLRKLPADAALHRPAGVQVTYSGRVCFQDVCSTHTLSLAFVPGVGFTRLCLDEAPTCLELVPARD
jgi:hypothetical protein